MSFDFRSRADSLSTLRLCDRLRDGKLERLGLEIDVLAFALLFLKRRLALPLPAPPLLFLLLALANLDKGWVKGRDRRRRGVDWLDRVHPLPSLPGVLPCRGQPLAVGADLGGNQLTAEGDGNQADQQLADDADDHPPQQRPGKAVGVV